MTITAEVVKDSMSLSGVRLTTFLLTYPKFIHAEFLTHRALSRNASSSRAIPFEKQVEAIRQDIAMPIDFRENKRGMQAGEALDRRSQDACTYLWKQGAARAIEIATDLHLFGVHKQYVNRILEPYMHITVVCTATDYANFLALRYHHMAQPEICELAKRMWIAMSASTPILRANGEWHLPFVTETEYHVAKHDEEKVQALIRKSVACCARTSYKNHDKTAPTQEQNDQLYYRLVGEQPIHASPAEHQAQAMGDKDFQSGNLRGWFQFRKSLRNENVTEFTPPEET